jgi:hemolysin activation/secretion protein
LKCLSPSTALSVAVLTMATQCVAADLPNPADTAAQALQRQQERERLQREQLQPTPDVRLPRSAGPFAPAVDTTNDLPCFPIRSVVLEGDEAERFAFALTALPEREQWMDAPICLGAKGINAALQKLQNAIVARGYVTTRVLAQPQDLKTGVLRLTVVPGRVRAIRLDDGGTQRGTVWNALPTGPGRLLDLRDIEQGLENFKRVPTAEADIQVAPGEQPGESDLLVTWRQGQPFRVSVSLDDSGSKATGKYQGSFTLSYDHWWTLNDLLYVALNHDLGGGDEGSKGTRGNVVHYSVPFGYWLVGATASSNTYHQSVAGLSQTYLYSGDSRTEELRLSRLLYRDAVRKTSVSLSGWTRSSHNFIDDTEVEVQRRRMAGWELGGTHREFIGPATLDLNLAYRRGTGARGAMPAPEEAFGEGTSRPRIVKADAQFSLPFSNDGQRMRYGVAWRAQWNRTPLVPQDRFSIGNRFTVRGFDGESTLSAERGWLVRQELGWGLADTGAELYLGGDYGEVGGPTAERLLGRRLAGGVLGVRGAWQRLSYDAFVGVPLTLPAGFETAGTTAGFNLNWTY